MDIKIARQIALGFDEAEKQPHFERTSFRIKKKIFATLDEKKAQMVLKLSETDQSVFCSFDETVIYPVTGAWGKQGWTIVELAKVREDIFKDAITTAYYTVAPKKLAEKYMKK